MPGSLTPEWRARWLPILFWSGVALASLAMLMLMFAQSGVLLRVAFVFALCSVVLIGFSVALRDDMQAVQAEIEEAVLDESDAIRDDVREDLVAAARKLHRTLREEIATLAAELDQMRAEAAAGQPAGAAARSLDRGAGMAAVGHGAQSHGAGDHSAANYGAAHSAERGHHSTSRTSHRALESAPGRWDTPERVNGVADRVNGASVRANGTALPGQRNGVRHPPGQVDAGGHSPSGATGHAEAPRYGARDGRTGSDRAAHGGGADPRRWDPSHDRFAEHSGYITGSASGIAGRRHAADPDEQMRAPERESRRRDDPWADLRGRTQPAEVRFGMRSLDEPTNGGARRAEVHARRPERRSYESAAPTSAATSGGREQISREPTRWEPSSPGPLDPGWHSEPTRTLSTGQPRASGASYRW